MPGSIWLEQIDKALVALIQSNVKLLVNSVLTSITAIPRYPDKDLLDRVVPCASLFNYDQKADKSATNKGEVLLSVDEETNIATMGYAPGKYHLYYQIDFWAKYQSDINEITSKWLTNLDNFDTLTVVDSLGVSREVSISFIPPYRNLDSGENDERMFRRTYSYKIGAELWSSNTTQASLLTQVTINKT